MVYGIMAVIFLCAGLALTFYVKKLNNKLVAYVCKVTGIAFIAIGAVSFYLLMSGQFQRYTC